MADISKALSVVRETLIQERALVVGVHNVITERLIGNGYGYAAVVTTYSVVRETLIKMSPISVGAVVLEVLVAKPSDNATEARMAASLRQTVVMPRPIMPDPGDVWSNTHIASYRELVVRDLGDVAWPRSVITVNTQHMLALLSRPTVAPADTWSPLRTHTLRMQVVQSRNNAYVPISALFVSVQRQVVTFKRAVRPAPAMWSALTAFTLKQHVVQSRVNEAPILLTTADVTMLRTQVVQRASRPAPWSAEEARTLRMTVVQARSVMPPGIDERVAVLMQQAIMRRTPAVVNGGQQVTMQQQLVVAHRVTYPPAFVLGWNVVSLRSQVVMGRTMGPTPWGQVQVAGMRLIFAIGRTTPIPIDVIDPAIGRHVALYRQLAVQHRVTVPPDVSFRAMRYVFGVARQVVMRDTFPLPDYPPPDNEGVTVRTVAQRLAMRDRAGWSVVSTARAHSVAESVAHVDTGPWDDPLIPRSDIDVSVMVERVVHNDAYPDPLLPNSEIAVEVLGEVAVVIDPAFPAPGIPQSAVEVVGLMELPILQDTDLPDPLIPNSEVIVSRLAQCPLVADPDLTGQFQMSELKVSAFSEFAIVRDPYLIGLPRRTGPRPIVSVSIS